MIADEIDTAYKTTLDVIKAYPNLKGIVAPTSVGIVAAAKAVVDAGRVRLDACGSVADAAAPNLAGARRREQAHVSPVPASHPLKR